MSTHDGFGVVEDIPLTAEEQEAVDNFTPEGGSKGLSASTYKALASTVGQVGAALTKYSVSDLEKFDSTSAAGGALASAGQGALIRSSYSPTLRCNSRSSYWLSFWYSLEWMFS